MITADKAKVYAIAAGVAVAAFVFWRVYSKGVSKFSQDAAQAATGVVVGAASGVVVGAGEAIGIPATDEDQCSKDLAAGDKWAASFSCPAKRLLGSFF
jgi:hypothetical protein